jgi:hypothetical protein
VAEGKKGASVGGSAFEVLDVSELVEEALHQFVGALLRYILDKHFLPHLLLRTHCIATLLLGTPKGLTVMLPPCVIIGVIVSGSSTTLNTPYPRPGCTCSCAESYNKYKTTLL